MPDSIQYIEKLVGEGRFLEARSKTEHLLTTSDDLRLKQLLALSMAKSGAPKAAMDFLEPVYKQHPDDPETSGILGSIYKELFKETKNSKYAVLSRDTYLNNFRLTGNYYTGINAASMYAISGSISKAKELAAEIIARLSPESTDAWELASIAEAYLLLKEKDKAIEFYLRCRNSLGSDWGKINSIYNQLWLLNHYITVSSQVMQTFSPPAVAAFVGHMIDHPSRKISRFPSSIEQEVKVAITGAIKSINAKIGYCSLACGSDMLFAEAILENGGELNLFLPFDSDDFIKTSVEFGGEQWMDRLTKLTAQFPVNYITKEKYLGSDDLFSFQSRVIFGAAVQRSNMLHTVPHLITVFSDADVQVKMGGTRDTLKLWPYPEKRMNINPKHFLKGSTVDNKETHLAAGDIVAIQKNEHRHVRFLVSINIESVIPELQERFNYQVNKIIKEMGIEEVEKSNTSLLFAFKTIEDSVTLAWTILKTPGFAPKIKLCMHAGPVYTDPETRTITGPNTDLVKAIHEFTIPGKVYASSQFAAVLSLETDKYAIEQAGMVSLGAAGTVEIYQVNRHADAFDL